MDIKAKRNLDQEMYHSCMNDRLKKGESTKQKSQVFTQYTQALMRQIKYMQQLQVQLEQEQIKL